MSTHPLILKRRPTTVEAWQVTPDNRVAVAEWCGGLPINHGVAVYTDTGDLAHAAAGDWIVRGPFGEFYPAPDKVMAATYEAVISVVSE